MERQQFTTEALINKRLNLNLLIQGAAEYASMNCHHLVRNEINDVHPDLLRLYDQFGIAMRMNHWSGTNALILGRPGKFWKKAKKPGHVFSNHPLLSTHGLLLNNEAKKRCIERSVEKGVSRFPIMHSKQILTLMRDIQAVELGREPALEMAVCDVVNMIWGIPTNRLEPTLTMKPAFGRLRPSNGFVSEMLRESAVGYSGVVRKGGSLQVVAKAWIWPLLSHELVKGTVELICLHGINQLDRDTYMRVMHVTDPIELEPWLLCVGAELWRRMLDVFPTNKTHATSMMQISRLDPQPLDELMLAVVERPQYARRLVESL